MKQETLLKMIGKGTIEIYFDESDDLTEENLMTIISAVQDNKVNKLHLYCNRITLASWIEIANALRNNTSLQELILIGDHMGDKGAISMAEALKHNKSLKRLGLERCCIGAMGAQALAEALTHNNTLRVLVLCENSIGDSGADAMATMLKANRSLRQLNLAYNNIHDEGVIEISHALPFNTTLTTLDLTNRGICYDYYQNINKIGNAGVQAIAIALQHNVTLTKILIIDDERIEIKKAFNDKMKINEQLQRQYKSAAFAGSLALNQGFWKKDHAIANNGTARLSSSSSPSSSTSSTSHSSSNTPPTLSSPSSTHLPYLPPEIVKVIIAMAKPEPGDIPRPESWCSVQ